MSASILFAKSIIAVLKFIRDKLNIVLEHFISKVPKLRLKCCRQETFDMEFDIYKPCARHKKDNRSHDEQFPSLDSGIQRYPVSNFLQ